MSGIVRSRLTSLISQNSRRRRFSSRPFEKEPHDRPGTPRDPHHDFSSSPAVDSTPDATNSRSPWRFLMFGLFAGLTGASATAGYVTFECTLNQVEEKAKSLRQLMSTVPEDASSLDKFKALAYNSALTVPIKATELYLDARRSIDEHVRGFTEPPSDKLLPDLAPEEQHVFTLVLDLNETLIFSDWNRDRGWRTFKRPGVDAFLEHLSQFYELVLYTDQMCMYVDPIMERLDERHYVRHRLSRAQTRYQDGKHYRDLSKLNRNPARVIYVSGHALESSLQAENCVEIKPWKLEADDTQLLDLIPFLEYIARFRPADIRPVLQSYRGHDVAKEFIERSREHQRYVSRLDGGTGECKNKGSSTAGFGDGEASICGE